MQQKVRHPRRKAKSRKTAAPGIFEAHRSGKSQSVQSDSDSPSFHPEKEDVCREKFLGAFIITDGASARGKSCGIFAGAAIILLKFYKRFLSPLIPPCCRFTPTCSIYGMEAFRVHGVFKGGLLTLWRLLRCNPFCKSGYDPVPPKGKWRP